MRRARLGAAPGAGPAGRALGTAEGRYANDDLGLSFYQDPPNVEVSVREFEEFTQARLQVLHTLDRECGFDIRLEQVSELPKVATKLRDANITLGYPSGGTNSETFLAAKAEVVRRDAVSHFALRLAFCKTRDAREWFLRQEQRLFVLKYDALSAGAKEAYLAASGVQCKRFEAETPAALKDLQHCTAGAKVWRGDGSPPEWEQNFYEMPFQEVTPGLISGRRVVISAGVAYVPASALKLILAKRFRDSLASTMDAAFQGLPTALADPRVGSFLHHIQEHGMTLCVAAKPTSDAAAEKLGLDNFEELMVRSFPPCMRRLVEKQREMKKHLKHAGRLQLRPFLKECGFTMDESFRWWKTELCVDPQIDAASYDKNYTYDLEHAYGKKGHLQGQNGFGCPKVIGFPSEGAGQVHGCPFKHMELPALKQQLHRWQVSESHLQEVEKLITNGKHYQLACIEYFKAKHPGHEGDGVGNAPGDYFRESCGHHAKKNEAAGGATTGQAAR